MEDNKEDNKIEDFKDTTYFLQVLKTGEEPTWPLPDDELTVGSESIGEGLTQFWAYPKNLGQNPDELPYAQKLATINPTPYPAILIDQPNPSDSQLDLVLVKDGFALARTETSLDNLEDNLNSLLEYAKQKFNIKVDHFMTTDKVSKVAENRLDEIEKSEVGAEGEKDTPEESKEDQDQDQKSESKEPSEVKSADQESDTQDSEHTFRNLTSTVAPSAVFREGSTGIGTRPNRPKSRRFIYIVVVLLIIGGSGVLLGRSTLKNRLTQMFGGSKEGNTPSPAKIVLQSPTPIPSPVFDRSKFGVRVLNGTSQTGAAGTLADKLKTQGWQIVDKPANATNSAFAFSQVRVKINADPQLAPKLVEDLSPSFQASVSADLKDSDTASAEVIIGKK